MGFVPRHDFSGGWQPNADPVNGPDNAQLRGDNLILDERGALALRPGSAKIATLGDLDVHSLFTTPIGGTRYRMAGAGNSVYANGAAIQTGMAGANDIAFGFHLGQILFARSTTKKKYDGATVRNWGIAMTGAKPTVVPIPPDSKVFATGAASEAPPFVAIENDGSAVAHVFNHYPLGDPLSRFDGALGIIPNATTHRAVYQKTFASPQDFTTYDAGERGTDEDVISWYMMAARPDVVQAVAVQIDVGDGQFVNDWYTSPFLDGRKERTAPLSNPLDTLKLPPLPNSPLAEGARTRGPGTPSIGTAVPRVGFPLAEVASGWMRVAFHRGDFVRIGTTHGKDWSTVKAIRVLAIGTSFAHDILVGVETIKITGGANRPLLGVNEWLYQYVRDASGYQAKSALSPLSDQETFTNEAAAVTIPADPNRDSQVNQIWLFRRDPEASDAYYRVAIKTGVSGTGPYLINDYVGGGDALTINIKAEIDNLVPPNNIIGIVGPHYDRTLVLTSDGALYPSRRLDPDAFSASQIIQVGGVDEVVYWITKAFNDVIIGTSKDLYRLEGTGGELPDGSVDYSLRPQGIDHRPVNAGIAHEGNQLAFFADDGWRATTGTGTTLLTGATSLLYQGETRHGVLPVNVAGGRVRAVLADGKLVAITPHGPNTTSSPVLLRLVFASGVWYRHTYSGRQWRSVFREPDGTLIAGDTTGFVWELDTGTADDGVAIPVVLWTKVDDLGLPYQRKKIGALLWRSETGGAAASIDVHLDGSSVAATTLTATQAAMTMTPLDLANASGSHAIAIARHFQFRLTGSFPSFHLYDYGLQFRERPIPLIGRLVEVWSGSPGVKLLSGFNVKCNTLGAARTVTAYIDGVPDPETFILQTSTEEPETHELLFTLEARRAIDIALAIDGLIEVDSWSPIVSYRQPLGVLVWDSGPFMDGERELVWLRELHFKVRAAADLVVTPWFDGTAFPSVTIKVTRDADTVYRIPVGRAYVGRQPRIVVSSCEPFFPTWVRAVRRQTGGPSQKQKVAAPFLLETGGQG